MSFVGGLDAAAASGANTRLDTVKLADFGWARRLPTGPTGMLTQDAYTLWYRCPEVLLGTAIYGPSRDVWAMGCACVEMSEFRPAFTCTSEIGILFKIFDTFGTPTVKEWPQLPILPSYSFGKCPSFLGGKGLQWGSRIGAQFRSLVQGVLKVVPGHRWSAASAAK